MCVRPRPDLRAGRFDLEDPVYLLDVLCADRASPESSGVPQVRWRAKEESSIRHCREEPAVFENLENRARAEISVPESVLLNKQLDWSTVVQTV